MKLILLILLPFFSIAQDSSYEPVNSTWITSSDTGKVRVYKEKYQTAIIRIDGKDELVYGGLLSNVILQKGIDSLIAHGKTIHYTNKGNVVYKEEGRPNYNVSGKEKEAESVYDIYPDPISIYLNYIDESPPAKYDTIGPFWKQVSHTGPGYNPVFAMEVYEVRIYNNEWITDLQPLDGGYYDNGKKQQLIPYHFAWLDLGKKPVKYKVWQDKITEP